MDYFIDQSSAINGDGSLATPWNQLSAVSFAPGNTYWLRRIDVADAEDNDVIIDVEDIKIIGWPKVGDKYYDSRPTNLSWDTDVSDYACLVNNGSRATNLLLLNNVSTVYISRLSLTNNYNTAKVIVSIESSSWCELEKLYITNNSNYSNITNGYVDILTSNRIKLKMSAEHGLYSPYASSTTYFKNIVKSDTNANIDVDVLYIINNSSIGNTTKQLSSYYRQSLLYVIDTKHSTFNITHHNELDHSPYIISYMIDSENCIFTQSVSTWDYTDQVVPGFYMVGDCYNCKYYGVAPTIGTHQAINTHMLIKADTIQAGYSNTIPVTLLEGAKATLTPFTDGNSVVIDKVSLSSEIRLGGSSEVHVASLANPPIVSANATPYSYIVSYYDSNGVYRYITPIGSGNSSNVVRVGGGDYSITALFNLASGTSTSKVTPSHMPLVQGMVPDGSHTLAFHFASLSTIRPIRPGEIQYMIEYTDDTGTYIHHATDTRYNTASWTGQPGLYPACVIYPITVVGTATVKAWAEYSYNTASIAIVYFDTALEVI